MPRWRTPLALLAAGATAAFLFFPPPPGWLRPTLPSGSPSPSSPPASGSVVEALERIDRDPTDEAAYRLLEQEAPRSQEAWERLPRLVRKYQLQSNDLVIPHANGHALPDHVVNNPVYKRSERMEQIARNLGDDAYRFYIRRCQDPAAADKYQETKIILSRLIPSEELALQEGMDLLLSERAEDRVAGLELFGLGKVPPKGNLTGAVLTNLTHTSSAVVLAACSALRWNRLPDRPLQLKGLEPLLEHPVPDVREAAMRAMTDFVDVDFRRVLALLLPKLDSPDRQERTRAFVALFHARSRLQAPEILSELEKALANQPDPDLHKRHLLHALQGRDAEIRKLLNSSEAAVNYVARLREVCQGPEDGLAEPVLNSLGRCGEAVPPLLPEVRQALGLSIHPNDFRDIGEWLRARTDNPGEFADAVTTAALRELTPDKAAADPKKTMEWVNAFSWLLLTMDPQVPEEAVRALVRIRNTPGLEQERARIVEVAEQLLPGSTQTVPCLIEDLALVEGEKVDSIRLTAVRRLRKRGAEARPALPALQRTVEEGGDWIAHPAWEAIQQIQGTRDPFPGDSFQMKR